MASQAPINVGVLLLSAGVQFLDVGPVDILGSMTPYYLTACQLPPHIVAKGLNFEFHYIVEEDSSTPFQLTSGVKVFPTDTITTAPKLDILLVPGPDPAYVPSAAVRKYMIESYDSVTIAVLTVCTGYLPAVHSGLFNGKTATAPRGLLPMLKIQFPDVQWEEKRWTRDGKLWSSGGVTNGMDLMSALAREQWDPKMVELVLGMLDVGSRGQEYPAASAV